MKEKIYTIPVNDAFSEECECPMCKLEKKTTDDLLEYFMGPSLMESDVRILTNEKGFCTKHLSSMYNMQKNRLGLGLMLHTHFQNLCEETEKNLKKAGSAKDKKIFSLKAGYKEQLEDIADKIEDRIESCALCDKLNYTMDRYIDVILWQYFEDREFEKKFLSTKGFCLLHLAMLLRGCAKYLTGSRAASFVNALAKLENESMETLESELKWFTEKFDYKNEKKPWGNSKDAVPRTIRKIVGPADLKQ